MTNQNKTGLPGVSKETIYLGKPFFYPEGSLIGEHFIEKGVEWDSVLRKVLPALFTPPAPVVVEVGANIGASTAQILIAKPKA